MPRLARANTPESAFNIDKQYIDGPYNSNKHFSKS